MYVPQSNAQAYPGDAGEAILCIQKYILRLADGESQLVLTHLMTRGIMPEGRRMSSKQLMLPVRGGLGRKERRGGWRTIVVGPEYI